eukprot:TRINITY_DN10402_c5_g1_i1.p1 TRINITY_DN10402_c5_g1~~TRINITY_DN10402_c5_g1_i1.p1  ORF type:complete len:463 (+),score=123.80 TRINITY_DN10402_c5_g1_i1:83-1471(+)
MLHHPGALRGPPRRGASPAADWEEPSDAGSPAPPLYYPRLSGDPWGSGGGRAAGSAVGPGSPTHALGLRMSPGRNRGPAQPDPRLVSDLAELEEENRVLRREVARLQQLNETRRRQLHELQQRLHEQEQRHRHELIAGGSAASVGEQQHSHAPVSPRRRPGPGGGGAPGRRPPADSVSPARGEEAPSGGLSTRRRRASGGSDAGTAPPGAAREAMQRAQRLAERWKEKAVAWEERYSLLWKELAADVSSRSSARLSAALAALAPPGRDGLEQRVELEESLEAARRELTACRERLRQLGDSTLEDASPPPQPQPQHEQQQQQQQQSPPPQRKVRSLSSSPRARPVSAPSPPREASPEPAPDCVTEAELHRQCAAYQYELAHMRERVRELEEAARAPVPESDGSWDRAGLLPGMHGLAEALGRALQGRNAALAALEASTEYCDGLASTLHCAFALAGDPHEVAG